jgi:hypothetical protein
VKRRLPEEQSRETTPFPPQKNKSAASFEAATASFQAAIDLEAWSMNSLESFPLAVV